jgi:hypothetical protein
VEIDAALHGQHVRCRPLLVNSSMQLVKMSLAPAARLACSGFAVM